MESGSAKLDESSGGVERLEEALWVAQARAGDAAAFGLLMRRYERPLLYYLRRLALKGDGALDVFQEVWVEVFRGLPSLQVPEAFRVWLYRIAHHRAARFVREEMRREAVEILGGGGAGSGGKGGEVEAAEGATAGEGSFEAEWNAEAVHRGLAGLAPEAREVLTLHYLHDLSTAELGKILGCPPGTVKSRLFHARMALRQIMERNHL